MIKLVPCEICELATQILIWYLLTSARKSTQSKGHSLRDATEPTRGQAQRKSSYFKRCSRPLTEFWYTRRGRVCLWAYLTPRSAGWRAPASQGGQHQAPFPVPHAPAAADWAALGPICAIEALKKHKDATLDMVHCREILFNWPDFNPQVKFSV